VMRADEAAAVAWVEKVGGSVTRDDKLPGRPVIAVALHGSILYDTGVEERAPYRHVTDATLKELAPLHALQQLDLHGTQVTGSGLKELAHLKNLQMLSLYRTKATDAGLKELAPLKDLRVLYLDYTQVSDAGLKELAPLDALHELGLRGTS